ncbi:ribonuclease J [Candidatus Daviesbacteria bacterium]|nr:ribonuclease J [Candidatus Daviesbacteria bacterium]
MKSFVPKFSLNKNNNQPLKLIPLGGVGDVTKNMYIYEYGDDIIIVDCGVGFPDEAMPGVDLVIPDISYLRDKKNKIKAILITHGHDDHIGGLPYLWPELQVPIYTQKLTCGFIRTKFTEFGLPKNSIHEVKISDKLTLGAFNISFYQVSHSVPDSMGIVIETPVGRIIHQADFKIDWTPVSGQVTDVGRVANLGTAGVKLLLLDCLRVEKPGFNPSEKSIESSFEKAALETSGKVLITMTSSNVSRMQQAINVAARLGRKVALVGRSFENNFQVARDLGYLHVPPGVIIASDAMSTFPANKLLILIAGSQGQAGSSLSRVANGEHKLVRIGEGDSVVFSADPIPSTETEYNALIDSLTRIGVNVYYSAVTSNLHVSGHAAADELKLMINLAKPQYLMGIGGTFRHNKLFAKMAQDMGYKQNQVLDVEDGDIINILQNDIKVEGKIEVQNIYVDGLGVGDIGSIVLRDRRLMSEEGIIVTVISLDPQTGKMEGEPEIISRGFVFEALATDLLDEAKQVVKDSFRQHSKGKLDWRFLRKMIEDDLEKFLYKHTERRPIILPVIVEI